MKIWFNKVSESRRNVVEVSQAEVSIGRDVSNTVVLQSPLVSRRHATVKLAGERLELTNVGLNSCAGDQGPHLALHAQLRGREHPHDRPQGA